MVMPSDPKRFENVAIYTDDDLWGNIRRIDARQATIWIGPYAQYQNAVFVEFVGVGKRKGESFVREDDPYVVVVPLDRAVEPDELYFETKGSVSAARYSTTDPRWRKDFDLKLQLSSAPILADYRSKDIAPDPPTLIDDGGKSPSSAYVQQSIAEAHQFEEFEREEGIRASSERSFFERLPVEDGATNKRFTARQFTRKAKALEPEFVRKLDVYTDLRDRGLVVKTGFKFGSHFRAYEEVSDVSAIPHSKYLVHALPEDYVVMLPEMSRAVRLAHGVRKRMIFAYSGKNGLEYLDIGRAKP